ncbi:MAG: NAD(P)/FAD-dependent oxidoreductase [Bacteriovoracaceae bacterium]|jgi:thioredoxin reductase (NADPH)|nr:NAD(P)/FAD-dependent oxidoreductase [Bacteriovoracaceae bacterium]
MSESENFKVAVVGGGSSGVMAALRGVLNNDQVVLYTGSAKAKKKSRALWVGKVENMPGHLDYKKGIVNPSMETLKWIASSPFASLLTQVKSSVSEIIKNSNGTFTVKDEKGGEETVFAVVLATGVMDVQPNIGGSIEPILPFANVQLVDYCIRCDGHHVLGKKTSIIGGGDGAAWVAILLKERYDVADMTIITNGDKQEFSEEIKKLISAYEIKVEYSPISEVNGNHKELRLDGFVLEDETLVASDIAFVSLGMIVYNELAKSLELELDERGFVKTHKLSESSVENVYAVGDLQAGKKNQIYTGWDIAVDAMDSINSKKRRMRREKILNS